MSKITVSFTQDEIRTESAARAHVNSLARDAQTVDIDDLTFVSFEPDAPADTSVEGRLVRIEEALARIAESL